MIGRDASKLELHFFIDIYSNIWNINDISSHALPITNHSATNMTKYHSLCLFSLVLFIFIINHPSCASKNKLVDEVCAKTSDSSFCIESLYSDNHTPDADEYGLADVAFRLAYLNATSTKDYIEKLLQKAISADDRRRLHICANDYEKAESELAMALNDLNSETFHELADYASDSSLAAENCQDTIKGAHSQLHSKNNDLKGLCEICVVVSKLFTGSLLQQ